MAGTETGSDRGPRTTSGDRNQIDQAGPADTDVEPLTDIPSTESATGDSAEPLTDEPATETTPDLPPPAAQAPAQPPAQPPVRGSAGTGSMIAGGVIAAALGAAVVLTLLPEGWRSRQTDLADRVAALEARAQGVSAQALQAALAPLDQRVAALESAPPPAAPDMTPLETRLGALESRPVPADPTAALTALGQRIDGLEADIAQQARTAVDAALAQSRAEVQAQAAALTTREEDVAAQQARVARRAAITDLVAAAESGAPAPAALAALGNTAAALAPLGDGLVTLSQLQDRFAPAARAALAAQPVAAQGESLGDRMLGFLRAQTGARSLTPRDGADTDSILSRAEAALRQGDLPGTLGELDGLTGDPAAAMAEWRAQAETRLAALAALSDLQTQAQD